MKHVSLEKEFSNDDDSLRNNDMIKGVMLTHVNVSSIDRWEVAKWSDCLLAPNEVCGLGVKMRDVRCKRSDGRIVTSDSCVGVAGPLPQTHVGCNVTCDNEVCLEYSEVIFGGGNS